MENQQEQEEIEINFKLDSNGRTTGTSRTDQDENSGICYDSRAVGTELWSQLGDVEERIESTGSIVAELLYDCQISDCGLMPRTFWIAAHGAPPRCALEQMALDVFRHHVPDVSRCDPATCGAEWWVQIRPSPEKTGRYAMHDAMDDGDMSKDGVSFHWDKDEDLRILCGGNTYVHPHLSTVTYLTDIGAPTLVLNCRVHSLNGEYRMPTAAEEDEVRGFLSWPKFGKHLSFDGRYLHAAPANLMEEGVFQKQCQLPALDDDKPSAATLKHLRQRHRRVTFLVNIWLDYKPFGVQPFPDTMIGMLSGYRPGQPTVRIRFGENETPDTNPTIHTLVEKRVESSNEKSPLQTFQWPLGDCASNEFIQVDIPLAIVRMQASHGGNVDITWQDEAGVQLCQKETPKPATMEDQSNNDEKQVKRQKLEVSGP